MLCCALCWCCQSSLQPLGAAAAGGGGGGGGGGVDGPSGCVVIGRQTPTQFVSVKNGDCSSTDLANYLVSSVKYVYLIIILSKC